jgi:hypothetical protein
MTEMHPVHALAEALKNYNDEPTPAGVLEILRSCGFDVILVSDSDAFSFAFVAEDAENPSSEHLQQALRGLCEEMAGQMYVGLWDESAAELIANFPTPGVETRVVAQAAVAQTDVDRMETTQVKVAPTALALDVPARYVRETTCPHCEEPFKLIVDESGRREQTTCPHR